MNQEQIEYVKAELGRGVSPDAIVQALAGAGYEQAQIEQLLQAAQGQGTSQIPVVPNVSAKSGGLPLWGKILIGMAALVLVIGVVLVVVIFSSPNSVREHSDDASDMTSLRNMRSQAEIHYSTSGFSYEGFCESPAAQSLLSGLTEPDCVAEEEDYRVSSRLLSGEYYCVDSRGNADRLVDEPTGLTCAAEGEMTPEALAEQEFVMTNNIESMRMTAELSYNDNDFTYSAVCADVRVEFANMPNLETLDCLAQDDSYRISAYMPFSMEYRCIDSTGYSSSSSALPTGLSCG